MLAYLSGGPANTKEIDIGSGLRGILIPVMGQRGNWYALYKHTSESKDGAVVMRYSPNDDKPWGNAPIPPGLR
jgi:hypothetical protein